MNINAYAADRGWLFADLLGWFARRGAIPSNAPLPDADAWICIRTDEWVRSPDPLRTVIQVHDRWPHDLPFECGALVLAHPSLGPLHCASVVTRQPTMAVPLGAPLAFLNAAPLFYNSFRVGWVGRPTNYRGRHIRSPQPLIEALAKAPPGPLPFELVLAGEQLDRYADEARGLGIAVDHCPRSRTPYADYPALYATLDLLVITSTEETGPMCLFEALASDVPVLSTPVGWAPIMLADGKHTGRIVKPENLAEALVAERADYYRLRMERKWPPRQFAWALEEWIDDCIAIAESLATT